MNIGLFTDTYYPELNGVANSVYLLKKELEKKGHNVYVITTKTPDAPTNEKGVFRVPSKACSFVPERRIGLFYHPKIARKIHKMKLDIIHTNTEFAIGMFGRIMAHELFVPVVHTYHTIYEDYTHYIKKYISSEKRAKQIVKLFSKFSVRGAEELIVPTEKVANLMRRYGVKPDINVIPTGIDLGRFEARDSLLQKSKLKASLGIPENNKVVLYLGRVSDEKNIDEVMIYLNRYMDQNGNVTFLVVGDGPQRSALERQARGLKHRKQIVFAGARPWDEITHYYQAADVFVSGSTSETQGLTYIEALASGLPVVARKDPCLDGVLFEGKNGYEFVDEASFVKGMDAVLKNPQGIDYEKNAMQSVEQFSTQQFADKVENIYFHVIKTHRNILMRMANKVAGTVGYESKSVKPLGGEMAMEIGDSNMDASRIALGCMRMAELTLPEVSKLINVALDNGVTLFDHADIYGAGKSEEVFGKALAENKGMRERMRIQTKCGIRDGYYDFSRAHILSSVDDSLKRLQIEYIDLLLLHRPDALMDIDEVADTLHQLQRSGKVKRFGVSNFTSSQIELLQSVCKVPLQVNQMQFGLMHAGMIRQGIETNMLTDGAVNRDMAILDYCRLHNITIQAWSPLQYGFFEGNFVDNEKFPEVNAVLERIAKMNGVTKSAIAIAWILRHPANMQVVVGTMNPRHLQELCEAVNVHLSRKEWYELYQAAGNILP